MYFKDAGRPVTARANVVRVIQFENCTRPTLARIVKRYGGEGRICLGTPRQAMRWIGNKKHVILVFLADPRSVRPFAIDKTGFGNACAWLTTSHINLLKHEAGNRP